jgi:hypothetical protein
MKTRNKQKKVTKDSLEINEVVRRIRDIEIEKKIDDGCLKSLSYLKSEKKKFIKRRIKK